MSRSEDDGGVLLGFGWCEVRVVGVMRDGGDEGWEGKRRGRLLKR